MNLFALNFIHLEYKHSRRLVHNEISIELGSENNRSIEFYAKLLTRDRGQNFHVEKIISIEKDFFDVMYDRILNLNFKELIEINERRLVADGVSIGITVGTFQHNISITIRGPDRRTAEADIFLMIIYDLLSLFDMQEWL